MPTLVISLLTQVAWPKRSRVEGTDLRALLDCGVAAFDDLRQAAVTPNS